MFDIIRVWPKEIYSFFTIKNKNFECIFLEPPPLPATLPPVGGHAKQARVTTTSVSYASGPNVNNNTDGVVRTATSWHVQTHNFGSNNNGDNVLTNEMVTNNNFLENERVVSAVSAG